MKTTDDMISNFLKDNKVTHCKTGHKSPSPNKISDTSKKIRAFARGLVKTGYKQSNVWKLLRRELKKYSHDMLSRNERTAINIYTEKLIYKR